MKEDGTSLFSPNHQRCSFTSLDLSLKCVCVCGPVCIKRLFSTWLSDAWSLLPGLSSLASHSAAVLFSPFLLYYLPLTAHLGEEPTFWILRLTLALFKPSFFSLRLLSSPHKLNLFSGLILLKTIWCVTSSGQEAQRGNSKEKRLACQVSVQWCKQNSTLHGRPSGG